jgi:hypothetical protein
MIRLSRHWRHQRENKIQNSRSQMRKHGRRVPLRSSTLIWWRSAIDSNSSAMRVLGSLLRATGSASLVGIRMNAGYSEKFKTTNEFARIKF